MLHSFFDKCQFSIDRDEAEDALRRKFFRQRAPAQSHVPEYVRIRTRTLWETKESEREERLARGRRTEPPRGRSKRGRGTRGLSIEKNTREVLVVSSGAKRSALAPKVGRGRPKGSRSRMAFLKSVGENAQRCATEERERERGTRWRRRARALVYVRTRACEDELCRERLFHWFRGNKCARPPRAFERARRERA